MCFSFPHGTSLSLLAPPLLSPGLPSQDGGRGAGSQASPCWESGRALDSSERQHEPREGRVGRVSSPAKLLGAAPEPNPSPLQTKISPLPKEGLHPTFSNQLGFSRAQDLTLPLLPPLQQKGCGRDPRTYRAESRGWRDPEQGHRGVWGLGGPALSMLGNWLPAR